MGGGQPGEEPEFYKLRFPRMLPLEFLEGLVQGEEFAIGFAQGGFDVVQINATESAAGFPGTLVGDFLLEVRDTRFAAAIPSLAPCTCVVRFLE